MVEVAPAAFERLGAEVSVIGDQPRRDEHQRGLRRDRPRGSSRGRYRRAAPTSASRSTATATACSRSTRAGREIDGDQIVAILALHLGVDLVAVTQMTNHGFHSLMAERGIRV